MNLNESERYQPLSLHYDRIRVVNAALIELIGPCTPVTRPRSGIPVMDIPAIGYSSSDLDRPGRLPHQQGTKRGEALATETGGPAPLWPLDPNHHLVFGGCAFLPFSLGPTGDCSCRH